MAVLLVSASSCMTNGGSSDHGSSNTKPATIAYIGEPLVTGPVSGTYFKEQTVAQVNALLGSTNRLVSIQVAQVSPLLLTGTMVPNTGNQKKTWWWYPSLSPENLQLYTQTLRARPVSLDGYTSNGSAVFAVVMISNAGTESQGWKWYNGGSLTELAASLQQFGGRIIDLRRTGSGTSTRYTALMVSNTGPDATQSWWYAAQTPAQISANLTANDAYLVSLSPADSTGATYDVVMNKSVGIGWNWYYDISATQLNNFLSQNQMRPVDVKSVLVNNQRFYTAIMIQNNAWTTAQQANANCDAQVTNDWLVNPPVTGMGTASTTQAYDNIWVPLIKNFGVAGGTVSVVKDGRLVLTRAYGLANRELLEVMHPDSIFRVASVSKQLTGVAILKLIDNGALRKTDTPFTMLGLAPNPPTSYDHSVLNTITVWDLLHHQGGFNYYTGCPHCSQIGDPVTANPQQSAADQHLNVGVCTNVNGSISCNQPANCNKYIQWVISHQDMGGSLAWTPGTTYDYSNFGYCVLGALIEKVTGTDYATWVTNNILTPSGARDVKVGQTLGVWDREVSYYDSTWTSQSIFAPGNSAFSALPGPYGSYYVEGSPASGGWAASSIDWLKFQAAIDGRRGSALLTTELGDVFAYPMASTSTPIKLGEKINLDAGGWDITNSQNTWGPNYYYGSGWDIHGVADPGAAQAGDWTHDGYIAGTSTMDIHMANGVGFTGFINDTARTHDSNSSNNVDTYKALWDAYYAADALNDWSSQDLFDQYGTYTSWMNNSQYVAYFNQQVQVGNYPTRVEGLNHFGTPLFRATFAPFKGYAWESHNGWACTDFQTLDASLKSRGYSKTSLQSYVDTDGTRRYQATWVNWSACSPSCTSGSPCTGNSDCQSGVCTNGKCAPPSCAPACGVGSNCGSNSDCLSGVCNAGKCAAPTCSPSCVNGQPCTANTDCASFVCTNGSCASPSCAAAPNKCNENNPCGADSDCGSNVCTHGLCAPPACSPSCGNGSSCNNNSNCASSVCGTNFTCQSPWCASQPSKCPTGSGCGANSDCGSGICMSGICQAPACSPNCNNGTACSDNGNCGSKVCQNAVCVPPSCSPNCTTGSPCGSNSDCRSHICTSSHVCQ